MHAILTLLLFFAPAVHADESEKYAWDDSWSRFSTTEYVVTGVAGVAAVANYYAPPPKSAVWKGSILFDNSAQNTLEIGTAKNRNRDNVLSDILVYPLIAYSMVDGPITTGLVGGNKDTAIQLSLINAETLAVNEALNLTVSNVLPRSRPSGSTCNQNSKYDPACVKSFWSGHTGDAFASASLLCTEHETLNLYGGKADAVTCGASLMVASYIGYLRIAANDHHASDVIVGATVGVAAGYLMPELLHFHFKKTSHRLGYLIPNVQPHGGGLTYVKAW